MFVMRASIGLLIVLVVAYRAFAQGVGGLPAPPRIFIELPDNIPSESVWIRYALRGSGGTGAIVKREPNLRRYIIDSMVGVKAAREARIVVYAPGCQFKSYTIDMHAVSEVSEHFQCDPLPNKIVHGFLPPTEILSGKFMGEKKLAISGEIEPDWVCGFFLEQIGGSCLGASIALGNVGELDPAGAGNFDITIPDFTRDPQFKITHGAPAFSNFGEIIFVLRDKTSRRTWLIKPENAGPESGLNIENEYANPVEFTIAR